MCVFCSSLLGPSGSCWSSRSNPEEFPWLLHMFHRSPLIRVVLWLLSLALGGFVPPGVNQLPHKQLLDQSCPGVFGVAAVGGNAVALDHRAAPEGVDLRRDTHQSSQRARTHTTEEHKSGSLRILQHL